MTQKARTNVSVDAALLAQARALDINLSATLDRGLRTVVSERQRERWLAENRGALADANAFVVEHGLWSDGQQLF